MVYGRADGFANYPYGWQSYPESEYYGDQSFVATSASPEGPWMLNDEWHSHNFELSADSYAAHAYANNVGQFSGAATTGPSTQYPARHTSMPNNFQTNQSSGPTTHQAPNSYPQTPPGPLLSRHHCDRPECLYLDRNSGQIVPISFSRPSDLQRHQLTIHRNSRVRYRCEECSTLRLRKDKMMEHCRNVHGQRRPYRFFEERNVRWQRGPEDDDGAWGDAMRSLSYISIR